MARRLPDARRAAGRGLHRLLEPTSRPRGPGERTPRRVGAHLAHHAVGWQIAAAMLGVLFVPTLAGLVAQTRGVEVIGMLAAVGAVALIVLHEGLLRVVARRVTADHRL